MPGLMMRVVTSAIATAMVLVTTSGCTLVEVRSKSKLGPEWRHKGSNRTDSVRWSAQQGLELVWRDAQKNQITTGVTYRRRDVDGGAGDNDNGLWLDFSFPLWSAPKQPDRTASRVEALERRLAALEATLAGSASASPATAGRQPAPAPVDRKVRRCEGDPGIP